MVLTSFNFPPNLGCVVQVKAKDRKVPHQAEVILVQIRNFEPRAGDFARIFYFSVLKLNLFLIGERAAVLAEVLISILFFDD